MLSLFSGKTTQFTKLFVITAMAMGNSSASHHVFNTPMNYSPPGSEQARFGLGCFWGAERLFWKLDGVVSTSVGYSGGQTSDPTYDKVCSGNTNHAEVVQVTFDPTKITYKQLLDAFWSNHDPTQVNRQGNDRGTQYRTCIFYFNDEQKQIAEGTRDAFQKKLTEHGFGQIATQILPASEHEYYYAEEYHQQYLSKNPAGYCGLRGTGCYQPGEINGILKA